MANITGILLNWKRSDSVLRILAGWQAGGMVEEAIVWNNNARVPLEHDWATVVTSSEDLGLYTRFAAACLATNECILIQDNDLELPGESLKALHDAWQREPDILHGVFGRKPRANGTYGRGVRGEAEAPIVLTRALLTHRRYAAEFFRQVARFEPIQREGMPPGNGEDIIFSYCVMHATGRLNRLHSVPVQELAAPDAIHGRNWRAHVTHRTRLMRACEAWLKESNHEACRDLHYV